MYDQKDSLSKVDAELFNKVMQLTEQIGDKEEHFNKLQTDYRKLASTWLLASLGASGYVLKSSAEIQFDYWYIIFGICLAASAGILILWMMDLKVYQKLLASFFKEGFYLEMQHYEWLPPFRINIVMSQKSGEIQSKVQYYYFSSITILLLLGTVAVGNFKIFEHDLLGKIICIFILLATVLAINIWLIANYIRGIRKFRNSEFGKQVEDWKTKTGRK